MGIPMRALTVMTRVLLCGSVVVAVFDGYDGMPRPSGMDLDPTTTYGTKPAVKYENKVAKCIWYGWENGNYPPEGTQNCSTSLWASLSAANPAGLSGFMYYVPLEDAYFDPLYNEYLCAIGCFDLTASGPAAGPVLPPIADPPTDSPPSAEPPVAEPPVALPPAFDAPPPVETTAPPSEGATVPPPPATLFRPPPPATPLPPSPTPTVIAEPPIESAPSPAISPETSPETSPLSSPGSSPPIFSPGTGPGPTSGGPLNDIQGGSATATSVPTVLVFTAALFLCINFLV